MVHECTLPSTLYDSAKEDLYSLLLTICKPKKREFIFTLPVVCLKLSMIIQKGDSLAQTNFKRNGVNDLPISSLLCH